jgi:hypothetical protein
MAKFLNLKIGQKVLIKGTYRIATIIELDYNDGMVKVLENEWTSWRESKSLKIIK